MSPLIVYSWPLLPSLLRLTACKHHQPSILCHPETCCTPGKQIPIKHRALQDLSHLGLTSSKALEMSLQRRPAPHSSQESSGVVHLGHPAETCSKAHEPL